ncbi:MAG: DUF1415 domain-containing protein [Candidatus Thiodiazotropha sp. (ex Lucinoma borealis)]|nr:DUF1415 domain-containing protein [Candidatus Thiodiazotropha sp. (ex Lucinoma borealis)]MCU7842051.1 DUF1415 domain-containing protein [Candidatus Thiodiazotropha sp. (ex Troendleina suluensis)]MCU7865056.1 DUF1415 domain-containing protein [Candidatus Thiodiazotropha sp. (ex Lucinoma borealis)]MCU7868720.1 DUF1415 domain-containing protein [Candidatus Thiodiazotropha sp. (ex Lucinoma borealis)]
MSSEAAIEATRCWVSDTVVGLNLCPFAASPLKAGRIRFTACEATDQETIFRTLLSEMQQLITLEQEQVETSLVIVPVGLESFDDYLGMLDLLEAVIPEAGLEGLLQLASFHPDYRFEGSDEEDPANYTNRSPFPLFHLIREDALEHALDGYPQPEAIPERNIALLRELGLEEMRRRLDACRQQGR